MTGGNGMAGAGWHLAVTGGGGGGLQTSGTGEDGTVGAGVVKGSDGGYRRATTVGSRWAVIMGGNSGQHAGRHGPQAAAVRHLPSLVTPAGSCMSQYRPSPLVGSPLSLLSPPPVPSPRLRHHPHDTAITASAWTVTASCIPTGGLACF